MCLCGDDSFLVHFQVPKFQTQRETMIHFVIAQIRSTAQFTDRLWSNQVLFKPYKVND